MDIKCFTNEAYDLLISKLHSSPEEMAELYTKNSSAWVEEYLKSHGCINEPTMILLENVDNIELEIPDEDASPTVRSKTDIENSIKIYEVLGNKIPPSYAASVNLWTCLCHDATFYSYMLNRWPLNEKGIEPINRIITRYIVQGEGARSRYRSGLSRLWWFAHITCDKTLDDPYLYTRILIKRQDAMENLLGREILLNKRILRTFLDVLSERDNQSEQEPTNFRLNLRDMLCDINRIGGVEILDSLSDDKLKNLFSRKYDEYII